MAQFTMQSPLGFLTLAEENGAITALSFGGLRETAPETPLLQEALRQLNAYFSGTCRVFTLPLAPVGTPFQIAVWQALCAIPYGETRSYGEIAAAIGRPKACRAVGMAIHQNPIAILIPCHRVVGKNGKLTGYAGGLERKRILLALEKDQ